MEKRHRQAQPWQEGFQGPDEGARPRIREGLGTAPKSLAARFYQLASGHAMTVPFLKKRFGWIDSDIRWWCGTGRQAREHLFKECITWREEIGTLWKEAAGPAGYKKTDGERVGKGRKGFGYRVRCRPGLGYTTVRDLLSSERYVQEVLRTTKVGMVKQELLPDSGGVFLSFFPSVFPSSPFSPFFLFFPCFPFLPLFLSIRACGRLSRHLMALRGRSQDLLFSLSMLWCCHRPRASV